MRWNHASSSGGRRPAALAAALAAAGLLGAGLAGAGQVAPAAASTGVQAPAGVQASTGARASASVHGPAGARASAGVHGPVGVPSPAATTVPGGAGPATPPGPATCTKKPDGRLASCAPPVRASLLPAGTRDTSTVRSLVTDPATMVDTRTWTSGGGNTYPGADVPFGMVQWSPDTMPNRNAGGGYNYGDSQLTGYSLTHISGPGCGAAGDVPILPMTGALPSGDPSNVTTSFTNSGETAQAGYYSAESNLPAMIVSQFAATPHSAMGRFTFPRTRRADFLIKLMDSQTTDTNPAARVVGHNEVAGSVTTGGFCGEANNGGQPQLYTVHFDIVFSQPFTASQIITQSGQTSPDAVFLTFNTTSNRVVEAKVGISYVSDANARLDRQQENPEWNFASVKGAAQLAWDQLLGRIQVSGGSYNQTQQFYSLLYKDFMQPNITSDVNGQFMGSDMKVHTLARGQQNQYGIYSGWDTYHSLSQLQAILDPSAAGDQAQSLVNYYAENGILQQWGYLNLDNYVMVGDPSDSIISDYYAFGARNFHLKAALADMLKQATTVNDVRPGEALEQKYGYLPEDGAYGCCNAHGFVPTLLEYDSQDLALSNFAASLGDSSAATMLRNRANNWVNVFDSANGLLNPRQENGAFTTGVTPTDTSPYVEGDAYEYLWNVPNDYAGLFSLLGGNAKVAPELRRYLSQPNGFGMFAQLTNEFDLGEQNALDYAGDPAGTQQAVDNIRNGMYLPGPDGLANNDDLGANSSTFVWEMLGMYPENSGSDNLVFASPGFPHEVINLPNGHRISISAPGASATRFYVNSLTLDGQSYSKLYVPYSTLAKGATLDWTLGTHPTSWGAAAADAPPSYGPVFAATASVNPAALYLKPGASGTTTLSVKSLTGGAQTVTWSASVPSGVTVTPSSGTLPVGASGTASTVLTVTGGPADGNYPVTISLTSPAGKIIQVPVPVVVAAPGDLSPYFNVTGISDNANPGAANYDGVTCSYSQQALDTAGLSPGASVTSGGLHYTWPGVAAGNPDAVIAGGQTLPVSAPAGATSVGFLGSAVDAGSTGAQGTATITYTDGTTSTAPLGFTDWTLGGGGGGLQFGNTVLATLPYRNCAGGQQTIKTYIFAQTIPVDGSKTVASVTLPADVSNGSIGIWAISTG
jgi:predicted alpha-1,2-mannosidase